MKKRKHPPIGSDENDSAFDQEQSPPSTVRFQALGNCLFYAATTNHSNLPLFCSTLRNSDMKGEAVIPSHQYQVQDHIPIKMLLIDILLEMSHPI
jgi:hypothetical protein